MNILSIQSAVALGYVGNSGAAFALRRLGHVVWPLDTVTLSNHPAHGSFRGRTVSAAELAELVRGLDERGALARCDAVLSGYLGAPDHGPVLLDAVATVKARNPHARFILDPVIGDAGRIYVKPGIAEFLRDHALPQADVLTPNHFELEFLAGHPVHDTQSALAAAHRVRRPASILVATGLTLADLAADLLTVLVVTDVGAWRVAVPRIDHPAYGAGDVFTAVLSARLLSGAAPVDAAAHAAAAVQALVAHSAHSKDSEGGGVDLALVEGQDDLVQPPRGYAAEPIS